VRDLDATLPVRPARALADIMGDTVKQPRFTAVVLTAFAIAALLIAAIGLYGVLAFDVAEQWRELGVRLALGASRGSIFQLILGRGMRLVGAGAVAGALISIAAARYMQSLLFDLSAADLRTFAAAAGVLAVTSFVATWLPARRATRADPISALRSE
jgi:putative ABC transport system permease protein